MCHAPIVLPAIGGSSCKACPERKAVFRCTLCDRVLEVFDGTKEVAYRLTVQPSIKALNDS